MALLAILQPDARAAARLTAALSGEHDVFVHPSWESLRRTLREGGVDGCLLDADHPVRGEATEAITTIRRQHRQLAIVVLAQPTRAVEYYALGELGADAVLSEPHNPTAVRSVVHKALASARGASIEAALRVRLPAPGPKIMGWAVEHAGRDATRERLAEALGLSTRGLQRALREAGLPAPSRVLLWGRLLLAGARLGRDGQTVEEVAFSLGYSTASSLSRAMKEHTGLTPRQVSQRGGMACVRESLFSKGQDLSATVKAVRTTALLFILLLQSACAAGAGGRATPDLRGEVDRILDAAPLDQVHFGVLAVDARSGRTVYARNERQKFVPASNQKVLVAVTALSRLGPDYRYSTDVWTAGIRNGRSLDGDLVVVATGDPSFSDRYWDSGEAGLRALADSVRSTGLGHVAGSLFVDVSAWDSATVGPTWEVADLPEAYGATGGAFAIDEGELEVIVRGGPAVGSPVDFEWRPVGTDDYVRSRLRTSPPDSATDVEASYLPESRQLVLNGTVAYGDTDTLAFSLRDPVRQSTAALARVLAEAGIAVDHGTEVAWTRGARAGRGCFAGSVPECSSATHLTAISSPPLMDLLARILSTSQNWMAEQLVRTLGAELGAFGSWEEGLQVVDQFLTGEIGIDSLDVSARDGSGLSRYNLITPRALVRALQHADNAPWGARFRLAMAEPGEADATLEERLLDLRTRLFAKTGTMSNINSLSGYLVRADGTEVVFSILSNGSGLSEARVEAAIDDVVRVLAR